MSLYGFNLRRKILEEQVAKKEAEMAADAVNNKTEETDETEEIGAVKRGRNPTKRR